MKQKESCALIVSTLVLTACGGGGGGGGIAGGSSPSLVMSTPGTNVSTSPTGGGGGGGGTTGGTSTSPLISTSGVGTPTSPTGGASTTPGTSASVIGIVSPPATAAAGAILANADIFTPPNSTGAWSSIVQGANYTFDLGAIKAAAPALKITSVNIQPVNTSTGSLSITTGGAGVDPSLGQPVTITNNLGGTSHTESVSSGDIPYQFGMTPDLSGVAITSGNGSVSSTAEYVLPFSPALNPAGYVYQTFGLWVSRDSATGVIQQHYFSAGAPTATPLPISGTANYTGHAIGAYVDAVTGDPAGITATMNATADFAALKVLFSTSGTYVYSSNALPGDLPVANSGLNLNGTLSYASGSNTFTGPVATANGMSGNATGRFYGPGNTAGTPPEIGGTFAVMGNGIGTMQGAFAGTSLPWANMTRILGTVAPPAAPAAPGAVQSSSPLLPTDMMLAPNSLPTAFPAITQAMDYSLDPAAAQSQSPKVTALAVNSVDTSAYVSPSVSGAMPNAPSLGQPSGIGVSTLQGVSVGASSGATPANDIVAGLPAVTFTAIIPGGIGSSVAGYVLPYSATINPAGYIYQTFGAWSTIPSAGSIREGWFSTGIPTTTTLPVTGTAHYTGQAAGTYVDAVTRNLADTEATMDATADFAALSIAFATTGTSTLPSNAAAGTARTANPGLDMHGMLNYLTGNNTFTGTVTTTNGMSGNATGRFYGPGFTAASAPPEIGGTFAVSATGIGAMEGAFAGDSATASRTTMWGTTMLTGNTMPPALAVTNVTYPGLGSPNMQVAPNSLGDWASVVQGWDYIVDRLAAAAPSPTTKVAALNVRTVDAQNQNSLTIYTGAAYPTAPALGQTTGIFNTAGSTSWDFSTSAPPFSTAIGGVVSQTNDLAGLPTLTFTANTSASASKYVLPYSATLNPAGYIYQTFGMWQSNLGNPDVHSEFYFSSGAITAQGTLPVMGTATYTGQVAGTYVDASTLDPASVTATMNANADFATRSVAFSTSSTTTLSHNAPAGALPAAADGLNMSGTLSYVTGGDTFTGAVTTTNGMSGNATGRFYGPTSGIPPEIGGTFAVMGNGIGAMEGAFGGAATSFASPFSITGTVTPSSAPFANVTATTFNMLVWPNSSALWPAIVQNMDSALDPLGAAASPSVHKVVSVNISPVDAQGPSMSVQTGASYPSTFALGQTTAITHASSAATWTLSTASGAVASLTSDLAGLPTVTLANAATGEISAYVLPYSLTMNPSGYSYQTFGTWTSPGGFSEKYFSAGVPAVGTSLPTTGSATYTGQAAGTYIDSATGNPSKTAATMNATANFATLSIAFATSGTTSLSVNAAPGTPATANSGLDMTGTLSFAARSNTFTGTVTAANGMSGNATGRFYGPGNFVTTATKVAGAPSEIGGTFAVMGAAGAMQGAFGGK